MRLVILIVANLFIFGLAHGEDRRVAQRDFDFGPSLNASEGAPTASGSSDRRPVLSYRVLKGTPYTMGCPEVVLIIKIDDGTQQANIIRLDETYRRYCAYGPSEYPGIYKLNRSDMDRAERGLSRD